METKTVLHAAVGAPVIAYHKVEETVSTMKDKATERRTNYSKSAEKAFEDWALEGEKVMSRFSEGKVAEEFSSRVDLDQAKEQVGKLRDQLEDMLDTWKHSFRPEKGEEAVEAVTEAVDAAEEKTEEVVAGIEEAAAGTEEE